jgi:putative copper export protein
MGEILTTTMRWLHITSMLSLLGGILYARFVMIPSESGLSPDARQILNEATARHFRSIVFAATGGLVLSGLYNYMLKPGHSPTYHMLFGIKILLVLHVLSVAIIATAPNNPRRARQLFGAAISGLVVVAISAYLKGIA